MRTRIVSVLAATTVAALLPALPANAALGPKWSPGPDMPPLNGAAGSEWRDVTATSPTDVWAVGVWRNAGANALTAHFDGENWKPVATPVPPASRRYELTGVDAVSPTDVWAVGTSAGSTQSALLMRFTGVWGAPAVVQGLPAGESALTDVDMLSSAQGWAVGRTVASGGTAKALIVRWNAGQWSAAALPQDDSTSTELNAVYTRSTTDAWAVGTRTGADGAQDSLVLHWDGTSWRRVTVPDTGGPGESQNLQAVAALTAGDVWAVGETCVEEDCRPLALHLTGQEWTAVPTAGGGSELTAVLPLAADDVWIVGYGGDHPSIEFDYAEHWDGRKFTTDVIEEPPAGIVGEPASALEGATIVPGTGTIWAVGWAEDPIEGVTHAIHRG
ncbi:hypothetical protein [Pseudosporangium ferrugineum]|uniref:Uncharacterized protein n=1 Tax=Pseudosporangium ferrugineum TaxID=439699 RepID=A0A2T0RCQ7_9ACTN|nr:hypothetical protein [Pseudosporangium ferrugineum]PRY18931.1 hypothetical protein CLV70_14110 [Pseudosporangium ferrugineum]